MGKKKSTTAYNDYLDGEKLTDNTEVRTTLQHTGVTASASRPTPASTTTQPKRSQPTHFLALPLTADITALSTLQKNLATLSAMLPPGVPSSAVRPVGTLHLTLGVMSLSEPELEGALAFLRGLDICSMLRSCCGTRDRDQELSEHHLSLHLTGLHAMSSSASSTSVLYASPSDESGRLHSFASALRSAFSDAGFLVPDTRPLKLHATVLNTVYARPRMKGTKGRIDARGLVEEWGGRSWGTVRVGCVRVCRMGAVKTEDEGLGEEYLIVGEKGW